MHLDAQDAVALTRLAAAALDVEREAARLVAACARVGQAGVEIAKEGEDAGVRGRIGARGAADGRLVDGDDLVDVLEAFDPVALADGRGGVVELRSRRRQEGIDDEARLAAPAHAGDASEEAERDLDGDAAEVVRAGADDADGRLAPRLALGRHGELALAAQPRAGDGVRVRHDLFGGALRDDLAAVGARAGAHVDDVIGGEDGLAVVLDDHDGVAEIAQADLGFDEAGVVACVKAHARLVEDVEDADERGADLGGEPDALSLAGREGLRAAIEGEVVEADVDEETQASGDGLEQRLRDRSLAGRERLKSLDGVGVGVGVVAGGPVGDGVACALPEGLDEASNVPERHRADERDVFAAELHGEGLRAQALALARVARARDEKAPQFVVSDSALARIGVFVVGLVGAHVGRGVEPLRGRGTMPS